MKTIKTNPLSAASFYTETFFNDIKLSTATSFAYKYKGRKYLVTNYHVAYGRNPETNQPMHSKGAIPNKLTFNFRTKEHINPQILTFFIDYPENENPFKYITINNQIVDIAICELSDEFTGVCINELEEVYGEPSAEENIRLEITESLFVLGYPRGINIYDTPIWKKSTIASEPDIDINNLPCFYIDSTTREGMSGAPVVFFSKDGIYKSPEYLFAVADRAIYQFVGVYSGRDRNDEPHIAQLGKVWKKDLIEKIIETS